MTDTSVGVHHDSAGRTVLHGRIVESTGEAGMPIHLRSKLGGVAVAAGPIRDLLADFVGFDAGGIVFVGLLEVVWSNVHPPFAGLASLGKECVLPALRHPPVALPTVPRIVGLGLFVTYEELLAVSTTTVSWPSTSHVARGPVRRPLPVPWTQLGLLVSWTFGRGVEACV